MKLVHRAVVLLSGGLDSATVLALATRDRFEVHAISFDYGQKHRIELEAARRLAEHFKVVRHLVVSIDPSVFGSPVLTGGHRSYGPKHAPPTYVPARNTLFLSHALAWAEVLGADNIFFGSNADDASGYPDCREPYIKAFEHVATLGTHAGATRRVRIRAPLLHKSKREVIKMARDLDVPLELTWSCYFPRDDGQPCGRCDACRLRQQGDIDETTNQAIAHGYERSSS